jgi:hypothetical protein
MDVNLKRRQFLGGALLAASTPILLGGCASAPETRYYDETVSSIMVSTDKKHIVFFGTRYHYIFDMPARLPALLESPFRDKMKANFTGFQVYSKRTMTGDLSIEIDMSGEGPEAVAAIRKLIPDKNNDLPAYVARTDRIKMRGKRYDSKSDLQPGQAQKLNRPYTVRLTEYPSDKETRAYEESPVRKMTDGALLIMFVPLIPLMGGLCFNCK